MGDGDEGWYWLMSMNDTQWHPITSIVSNHFLESLVMHSSIPSSRCTTHTQQCQVPSAVSRTWWNCGQRSETNSPHMGYITSCLRHTGVVYYYGFTMIYHQKTYPKKKDTSFYAQGVSNPTTACVCFAEFSYLQFWIVFLGNAPISCNPVVFFPKRIAPAVSP